MRLLFSIGFSTSFDIHGRASGSSTSNDTSTRDTGGIRGTGGTRNNSRR